MAQSFLSGTQVIDRVGSGHYLAGNSFDHFDACVGECQSLVRIIGKQPNLADTKLMEDRGGQTEIAAISRKSECKIRIHCIETAILKRVGLQFSHPTDATAFLIFVDQKSPAFLSDGLNSE